MSPRRVEIVNIDTVSGKVVLRQAGFAAGVVSRMIFSRQSQISPSCYIAGIEIWLREI